ncbi:DUF63 family protein [Candidatus Nanohalobium constans]|uniref:Putative membrane protein n=1 Tax=Candidatus Nanohalobium constans TaxID=2565781 RepID=A0A5Q0UG87_9ARCH|nr:DUF63 family protein [Candidatus Nanohalobium constans]QGA80606.1 putative membrane protein [Candidatus Nanohalobium constans]
MKELLWKYIVGPIVADAKGAETVLWNGVTATPGYNPVNTVFYILLASATIYAIYRLFHSREFDITPKTAVYTTPFILLGGTLRFLDDAQLVQYPYSIPLITPLIYFLIAAVFLPATYKLEDKKLGYTGTALLLPVIAYAVTGFKSLNILYVVGTAALTLSATGIYYFLAENDYSSTSMILLAFTQFFEGSASMISSFYSYNPKQLLAQAFNSILGFPGVFVMKTGILLLALSIITDLEDEKMKALALITLYSIGLGTGFRVFLRVAAGI